MTEGKTNLHVHQAMCSIKRILAKHGGITKDREAPAGAGGYAFRGIDDMYNVLCGLTAEHDLVLYPRVMEVERKLQQNERGKWQTHVYLTMEIDFVSAVDGSQHMARTIGEGIDLSDKASGKSMSTAYKYAHIMAFQIPTDGESDVERDDIPVAAAPQQARQQPAPPPPPQEEAPKKRTRAAKAAQQANQESLGEGSGPDLDGPGEAACANIRTFPLLFAFAQEANKVQDEPRRTDLFAAIHARAEALFQECRSQAEVKEGFPLVTALGQPERLKRAANEAYARFRVQPQAS